MEAQAEEPEMEELNLTLDFTNMALKKKKKKKKDLDELMAEERKETEANENGNYLNYYSSTFKHKCEPEC